MYRNFKDLQCFLFCDDFFTKSAPKEHLHWMRFRPFIKISVIHNETPSSSQVINTYGTFIINTVVINSLLCMFSIQFHSIISRCFLEDGNKMVRMRASSQNAQLQSLLKPMPHESMCKLLCAW